MSTTLCPRDPVADFKKGIKRDPTLFLDFKMERQWVSWQQSTLAQAHGQDMADVLDPAYAPSQVEDKLLFEAKQKYLYAVFEQKLQTHKGKALVREYKVTSDAQAIHAALLDHYTKSVKALLDQSQLMVYITTIKIGDGSWCGSAASFVLSWQDKVREF
jgi:deoxyhypusine synthase